MHTQVHKFDLIFINVEPFEAGRAGGDHADSLLHRFLERPTNAHHLDHEHVRERE